MANSGYSTNRSGSASSAPTDDVHAKRKREYLDYIDGKTEEIKEQKIARAYYHGAHWTAEQVRILNARKQPVVTFNRVGRKINAVVGLLEKQKQDPRGFPRTPQHEQGADLATAVLRYVCDQQQWATISPICGMQGAVDGIAGVEITIEQGDQGDPEIGLADVDPSSFFYDPRSLKEDYSDARYMGVGKWIDLDAAIEMFPEKEQELRDSVQSGYDLTSDPESDNKWMTTEGGNRRIRLVDHWYIKGGQWRWCQYTGAVMLAEGESYLEDERGKTICRYIMWSANVDQDGDRYGFVRGMKSPQDEINQRRSKGLHQLNTRRIFMEDLGEGLDVEKIRKEMARPDGVVLYPAGTEPPTPDDSAKNAELQGQLLFLQDARQEIENYGFNPALLGTGVQDMSGRAIQLQQQAGIAELGPYLLAFKGWKLRVYRAIWNAVRKWWTSERWIRVTDDEQVAQFVGINQPMTDQMGMPVMGPDGQPQLQNQIAALDVDIIIDEGPDTINMQQDAYDTLSIMATKGQNVPPELLIELSPLAGQVKKKAVEILEKSQQQQMQIQQPMMQAEMAGAQADVAETQASARLKEAQTVKTMAEAQQVGRPDPIDHQAKIIDLQGKQQDRQINREKGSMELRGKELDLIGKELDIKRQREAPRETAGAA